jgi:hypothetical protein
MDSEPSSALLRHPITLAQALHTEHPPVVTTEADRISLTRLASHHIARPCVDAPIKLYFCTLFLIYE